MPTWTRARLAELAMAAALCLSVAGAPSAQDAAGLRVVAAIPNGPVNGPVTQASIRFSEPMVALGAADADRVAFVRITPTVPVSARWADTDVLVITPVSGRFPHASRITIAVDAGAVAASGRRLETPASFTFDTPAPQLLQARRGDAPGIRVTGDERDRPVPLDRVALVFDQPVRADDAASRLEVTLQPDDKALPTLDGAARAYLSRVDPAALRAHDAWVRATRAAVAPRRLAFTVVPKPEASEVLELALADPLPLGGRVAIRALGVASPEGPLRRETPDRQTVSTGTPFTLAAGDCAGTTCEAAAVALDVTRHIAIKDLRTALTVTDITTPSRPRRVTPDPTDDDEWYGKLEELGYTLQPRRRYAIRVDAGLTTADDERLPAPWCAIVEIGLPGSFITFGTTATAVWEKSQGPRLPILTRSVVDVRGGAVALPPASIVPALTDGAGRGRWPGAPRVRQTITPVPGTPDGRVRELFVNVASALSPAGTGVLWASYPGGREARGVSSVVTVRPGSFVTSTIVQVTNIGITVRGEPSRLVILASRLDTAAPIADAAVTLLDSSNRTLWRGRTDASGLADARERDWMSSDEAVPFAVVVEREGDVAFVQAPVAYGFRRRSEPSMVGVLFTDRALYRPGETAHVRALVQEPRPEGLRPLPAGTTLSLILEHDGDAVTTLEAALDAVGGAEWTLPIPATVKTDDDYRLVVRRGTGDDAAGIGGPLYIKAFRPQEFRVEATASADTSGETPAIAAAVHAEDLSEVPLAGAATEWTIARTGLPRLPEALERDPDFMYAPFDQVVEQGVWSGLVTAPRLTGTATLDANGDATLRAPLPEGLLGRGRFTVAMLVRDASSQVIGQDAVVDVAADAYLGVAVDRSGPVGEAAIRVVARRAAGAPVAGVEVDVVVRRTGKPDLILPATTAIDPVRVVVPEPEESQELALRARGARRVVMPVSATFSYWTSRAPAPDAPSLALSLDRQRYVPGDTAHLRIESGWGEGTALVTLARGAVLQAQVVRLAGGRAVVDLPVGASPTGGLRASVALVRGRINPCCADGPEDPGAPRTIEKYVDVPIDRTRAQLAVTIDTPPGIQAPGSHVRLRVRVRGADGGPAPARVTLWAVDEGVLGLTNYAVPRPDGMHDIDPSWLPMADNRSMLLGRTVPDVAWAMLQTSSASRMVPVPPPPPPPPGQSQGGDRARHDLRPLAFWFGALETDADGVAAVEAALPDTLTTYRVIAVAADPALRYGSAAVPMIAAKPLMVRPALPRVLTRDDRPTLRAVVAARELSGRGTVRLESLTPDLLAIDDAAQAIAVAPDARATAAFAARALKRGTARIRVTATVGAASDTIERDLPIVEPTIDETSAAFGETAGTATEAVRAPDQVDPASGGLDVEVASTLLVGLAGPAQYINGYRYFCAEQMASRAYLLTLAPDLGPAFSASLGLGDAEAVKARAQEAVDALEHYRCGGGYGYWRGNCALTSPALTAYVLHVLQEAGRHGFTIDGAKRDEVSRTLSDQLAKPLTAPSYQDNLAARAFAVKVLADAGQRPVRAIDGLYERRTELPAFAMAHLMDAIHRVEPKSARLAELRRLIASRITPAGATAQVEDAWRPEYAWLWPSTDKSTGIVLDTLTRTGSLSLAEARPLVAGLMRRRQRGVWMGTQGNIWVLAALSTYRRTFESSGAPVTATATLGSTPLLREALTPEAPTRTRQLSMPELTRVVAPGRESRLTIASSGSGPVFYATRLAWRRPAFGADPLDHGITVARRYERLVDGKPEAPATTFTAGDVVRVTLTLRLPEERTFIALSDPLPAGFEAIDTTLAGAGHDATDGESRHDLWGVWRSGFDQLQRYDDRVDLFATSLGPGVHTVSYVARATTPGTFFAAPPRAEAMYEPEVAGRGAGAKVIVTAGK